MKVTNVVICKADGETKTFAVNDCDSTAPDEMVDVNVDYDTLTQDQKDKIDAAVAVAETFIPA